VQLFTAVNVAAENRFYFFKSEYIDVSLKKIIKNYAFVQYEIATL
jgi:hypothetical protein